jgi:hypothetical protein
MKKQLSNLGVLAGLSVAMLFGAGCDEQKAAADEPKVLDAPLLGAPAPDANPTAPAAPADVNATNAPDAKVVKPAEIPEKLNMSPGLKELAKLVQAGVSEDVLLAYITNSAQPFNLGSDELVYLNDLGVSSKVQTAILQHDSSPQFTAERKHIAPPEPAPAPATNPIPPNPALQPPPPEPGAPIDPNAAVAPPPQDAYASYYNTLAPYGNWVQVDGYGLCWQPTVAIANSYWRPYSNAGRWLWTDNGWYWYSDYTWGWAPFHYGRWCSYPRVGWIWVPDTVWGPSWVSWRYTSAG